MSIGLIRFIPVFPTSDIARDTKWYEEKAGFKTWFADQMYAVLYRDDLTLHLQWHADTPSDPLLGGSVARLQVENIHPIFDEFVGRGTVAADGLRLGTPWNTNEFGFYDLNRNAIFFMEDLLKG